MKMHPLTFTSLRGLACGLAVCAALPAAQAQSSGLPLRNLTVELRQVDEAQLSTHSAGVNGVAVSSSGGSTTVSGGATLSTQRRSDNLLAASHVRVVNGGRASIAIGQSTPVQWVQAIQVADGLMGTSPPHGAGGRHRAPVVVNAVTWLQAGRSLTVLPRWPGGDQPATVEVQTDSAAVDTPNGQPMPTQTVRQTVTTVLAPLGEWVTIATTSGSQQREQSGTLSSTSASGSQMQTLQVRVLVP
jgi:hypothetical protein